MIIGAYGHSTVSNSSLPVGIGTIRSDHRRAWVDAAFLDTPSGRAHYDTVKALGPLQEWSYTYRVDDASTDFRDREPWPGAKRVLKALTVIEVAPVLKAAGIDTMTNSIKDGLVRVDELIDENAQRLMNEGLAGIDPEVTAIWQELQRERDRTRFLDLRFV